ncbi:MAG: GTP-binding protein Era [Actinomycetota bacterium]|jgi:GTP-binding protein Era
MSGRSGFISFVGRPNVGKSTLMNALVGEKIAITSSKPQTTRRAIRGIVTRGDNQIIIVDTPGLHRPRTLLGERLNALVESTLGDVDIIGMCLPAGDPIGPGDRYIMEQLSRYPRSKRIAIITKTDTVSPTEVLDKLTEIKDMLPWDLVVPLSGKTGDRVDILVNEIIPLLPESPLLYDESDITDEKAADRISELVREAALEELADELPHSLAVTLEDIVPGANGEKTRVFVNVIVERDSQKGIIIGHRGSMLRLIGERSRPAIEAIMGEPVFLALHVKVAKDWQRDPKQLGRLGF